MKILVATLVSLGMVTFSGSLAAAQPSLASPAMLASAASCAAGDTYVKSYKKSDGTVVSGYCRHSANSSKDCVKGEIYVHSYKKSDGTEVKGYCRKASPGS